MRKWQQNIFRKTFQLMFYANSTSFRCVITSGATGSTGATGATGQRQASGNKTTTRTAAREESPCEGPVGKQLSTWTEVQLHFSTAYLRLRYDTITGNRYNTVNWHDVTVRLYLRQHRYSRIFNWSSRNLPHAFGVPKGRTGSVATGIWKHPIVLIPKAYFSSDR